MSYNKSVLNKLIVIFLVIVMVAGSVLSGTMVSFANIEKNILNSVEDIDNVFVQRNGENITSLQIKKDEKVLLSSYTDLGVNCDYKWEILVDAESNKWASIYDCNDINLEVTYGLVSNFLNSKNMAQIRSVVELEGDTYISDSVIIEVVEKETINTEDKGSLYSFKAIKPYNLDSGEDNTVTLCINYYKDTGEKVCDSYIATIYKGMHFKTTVTSPIVAGYQPKYSEDDTELVKEYTFDFDSVTENVTVNIYYYPIDVKYEVRYLTQGIYDDEYTVSGTPVIAYGKVGDEPDMTLINKEFEGFTRINYQPEVIAADGSTVFQCFYDREYYLVDLDLNGGYGVDSVYAKYDTVFVVNQPERAGWVFKGWDADGDGVADEMPSRVPARNTSYTALWETTETSYTVVFWYENANDDKYSVVGTKEIKGVKSNTIVKSEDHKNTDFEGRDSKHFTYNTSKVESKIVEGDGSTTLNVYFKRNMYSLSFTATDVCGLEVHSHTNSCKSLVCGLDEHSHKQECGVLTCKVEEHIHSDKCCSINPENHTHTTSCFDNVGAVNTSSSAIRNAPTNPQDGYIYRRSSYYNRVIYINGTWYVYNGTESSKTIKEPNDSCEGKHIHGSANCDCKIDEHSHIEDCYKYHCGYITHSHNDDCYKLICPKPEHSHTNNCNSSSRTNTVKVINAKYQQDIKDEFPITSSNGKEYLGYWWKVPSGATSLVAGNYIISLDTMTGESLTFSGTSKGTNAKIYYYVEALAGEEGIVSYEGKNFNEHKVVTTVKSGNLTYEEEFHPITGFERWKSNPTFANSSSNPAIQTENFMYYSRKSFNLQFFNKNEFLDDKEATVQYEASLNGLYFKPDEPEKMEENAYYFEGWYTTEGCYEGTKFDFTNGKMPANDMVLYANWLPKVHDVTFYNTYQDMVNGEEPLDTVKVTHGNVVESSDVPEASNQGYIAGEWFYIKNGEKVAYRPISIPVKSDLKVYRDWSSNTVVDYTVNYYKLGTTEKVAESITGWMFDGTTKTFKAKGGGELGELYDDYLIGWYPTVSSTSIVADINGDNVINFYYDYQNPNPYIVKYVDSNTGLEVAPSKTVSDNAKSVVTEIYKPVDGYMPDAFYKQLVLALNKDGGENPNVITFYYSKANDSAYYAVEYYFMNPDGTSYKLNAKIQSPIEIGSNAVIPEVSDNGYIFEKCQVKDGNEDTFTEVSQANMGNIKVNKNGALIQVYYAREKTSYTVHYYINGTTTSIKDDKVVGDIYFGTHITEEADSVIDHYSLVSDKTQSKELVLDSQYNEFIFFYDEHLKTANYKVVCTDDRYTNEEAGYVSHTLDIKKYSEDYNEVTATNRTGFYFEGWYSDKELKNLISNEFTIQPDTGENITYYAAFSPYYEELKITKVADKLLDNQTFIFNIQGIDDKNKDIELSVSIHGNGDAVMHHLPIGTYRVIEDGWSWKYNPVGSGSQDITLVLNEDNALEFKNNLGSSNWLSGDSYKINVFR